MILNLHNPSLLLDEAQCKANIFKMASKIGKGCLFRPHFKTHQSAQIGQWFRDCGIDKITVSSPAMAHYFIENGWRDITIAMPFNMHWIPFVNSHAQNVWFNILVEDEFVLKKCMEEIIFPCGVFIKIDTGYRRTGLSPEDSLEINNILNFFRQKSRLKFMGFLTHAGHTYKAKSKDEIIGVYYNAHVLMSMLKQKYIEDFPELIISYGDTPSCSIAEELNHFDEYRPGNFVFYDLMQLEIGSCTFKDIALIVLCDVIAKHAQRMEIVVHCGAVHLSKDSIEICGKRVFGELVSIKSDNTWERLTERAYMTSLSQEHGIIQTPEKIFNCIKIGDTIGVIPVHSCLSMHQLSNLR
ncbi:MAG: alanine racemase [Bacteroidales bacterium]|nr:alanine racemase [Bacteroidales bacterium]